MSEAPQEERLPPSLRLLKGLVIVLTLTMIAGVITIVGLIVTRLPQAMDSALPALPAGIALPTGETVAAATFGKGWIAVVTESGRILVFSAEGQLVQDIAVTLP